MEPYVKELAINSGLSLERLEKKNFYLKMTQG